MMENAFREFLYDDPNIKSDKAVASRLSKARKAEEILGMDFDYIVSSDDLMYDSLVILRQSEKPANGVLQNALRKYYIFKNGKEFPRLNSYRR